MSTSTEEVESMSGKSSEIDIDDFTTSNSTSSMTDLSLQSSTSSEENIDDIFTDDSSSSSLSEEEVIDGNIEDSKNIDLSSSNEPKGSEEEFEYEILRKLNNFNMSDGNSFRKYLSRKIGFPVLSCFLTKHKRKKLIYILLYVLSTLLFKFSFESVTIGFQVCLMNRLSNRVSTTVLIVSMNVFYFSQCSEIFAPLLLKKFRASLILSIAFVVFGVLIAVLILVEFFTGGKFWKDEEWGDGDNIVQGWNDLPYLILGFQFFLGSMYGLIEVLRKYIAPLIIFTADEKGRNENELKRLNSLNQLVYGIAGVGGGYFSGFMVNYFGFYGLCHVPIFLFISAILTFFIFHEKNTKNGGQVNVEEEKSSTKEDDVVHTPSESRKTKSLLKKFSRLFNKLFAEYWEGFKLIFFNSNYNFLLLCYALPQVCQCLKEWVWVPVYSENILEKYTVGETDWLNGALIGCSNLGELVGAIIILFYSGIFRKTTRLTLIISSLFSGLSLNLYWFILVFKWKDEDHHVFNAIMIALILIISSAIYVVNDTLMISYVQTTIKDKSKLAHAQSILFFIYIILMMVLLFAFGRLITATLMENITKTLANAMIYTCITIITLLIFLGTASLVFKFFKYKDYRNCLGFGKTQCSEKDMGSVFDRMVESVDEFDLSPSSNSDSEDSEKERM